MGERSLPIGLLSDDVVEVLSSDIAVTIKVCLREDFLNLIIGKVLSQLDCNLLELLSVDLALNEK